jgi:hypothetical protein
MLFGEICAKRAGGGGAGECSGGGGERGAGDGMCAKDGNEVDRGIDEPGTWCDMPAAPLLLDILARLTKCPLPVDSIC